MHNLKRVKPESLMYRVISGDNEGRLGLLDMNESSHKGGNVRILFDDLNLPRTAFEPRDNISVCENPGWEYEPETVPYGYQEHLERYGTGVNLLRTERCAQPWTVKVGDMSIETAKT